MSVFLVLIFPDIGEPQIALSSPLAIFSTEEKAKKFCEDNKEVFYSTGQRYDLQIEEMTIDELPAGGRS